MTESYERERVRFDVSPDGSVEGDGADGRLAETLRYACRMGSQIGALLELGELDRLSTLSNLAVMARVSGTAPHLSIRVEIELQDPKRPDPVAGAALGVQEAIDRSLRRVSIDLASDWAAIITEESRLVGAVHDEAMGRGAPESVFEVGVRALAILGALEESWRDTAVRLDFVRGSVLVVAIGGHALYTQADKFDVSVVVRTVAAAQGLLSRADLARADLVTASRRV